MKNRKAKRRQKSHDAQERAMRTPRVLPKDAEEEAEMPSGDPDAQQCYRELTAILARLRKRVAEPRRFRELVSAQGHLLRLYLLDPQPGHPTAQELAYVAYFNGTASRMFDCAQFTWEVKIVQILAGARASFQEGSFIVGLSCLRSILEQVAQFCYVLQKIRRTKSENARSSPNDLLILVQRAIVNGFAGSRFNWNILLLGDKRLDEISASDRDYPDKPDGFADQEASNILTAMDKLDKKIAGTRTAYGVLCEFAHPNIGSNWALYEEYDGSVDRFQVQWRTKCVGLVNPQFFVAMPIYAQLLANTCDVLQHWEATILEAEHMLEWILELCQQSLRTPLRQMRPLFKRDDPCPCGSGKSFGTCCTWP